MDIHGMGMVFCYSPYTGHFPMGDITAASSLEWLRDLARTTSDEFLRTYLTTHEKRLAASLSLIPPPHAETSSLLELACWGPLLPYFKNVIQYNRVLGVGYKEEGKNSIGTLESGADAFEYARLDVEGDPFPFVSESIDTVLAWELIEHLAYDPMFMLSEINRVLKPGGRVFITTPNIASARSLRSLLWGGQPQLFSAYNKRRLLDRHHIEYSPPEIFKLMAAAGLEVERFDTADFYSGDHEPTLKLLADHGFPTEYRGDTILVICKKVCGVNERYPEPIYE
jgi:SAM-dependent methyltransferase